MPEAILQGETSEAMVLFSHNDQEDTYSPLLSPHNTPLGTLVTFREERKGNGSEIGDETVSRMDHILRQESLKADFQNVSKGRLHKSMKRALINCYTYGKGDWGNGQKVVYRTAGKVRKDWELVVVGDKDATGNGMMAIICEGKGRVC